MIVSHWVSPSSVCMHTHHRPVSLNISEMYPLNETAVALSSSSYHHNTAE